QTGVLRRYNLTYGANPVTSQSVLKDVTECARVDWAFFQTPPCKAPLVFTYTGTAVTFQDKSLDFAPPVSGVAGLNGFQTADVNGDGLDDLLYRVVDSLVPLSASWRYRLSNGQGFGNEQSAGIPAISNDGEFGAGFVDLDRNYTVDALFPTR